MVLYDSKINEKSELFFRIWSLSKTNFREILIVIFSACCYLAIVKWTMNQGKGKMYKLIIIAISLYTLPLWFLSFSFLPQKSPVLNKVSLLSKKPDFCRGKLFCMNLLTFKII